MLKLMASKQILFENGRMEVLGIRDCFTPLETYVLIQKEVFKKSGSDLIYSSAKKAGYNWFKKMAENFKGLTQSKASQWGVDLVALSGWGQPEIEKIDFSINFGIFNLRNSTLARAYGTSTEPVDHLFRGLLAGGMSFGTKSDLDSIETHCLAKGDSFCRFLVGPKSLIQNKV